MKRIVLIATFVAFSLGVNAQEGLRAGINLALPVGDASDASGFSIGIDALYHWAVTEEFTAGIATGFTNAFGKTIDTQVGSFEVPDVQFLPLAASGRYSASDAFRVGIDLGYAIGISENNDGGFYYRPIAGYAVSENTEVNLSYTGISLDGGTWSTIALGVLFAL